MPKTLRLILGDQLNIHHSWFRESKDEVTYVMMEVRSETDYVVHHIQKVLGFFAAMREFGKQLEEFGHRVIYIKLNQDFNAHTIDGNCLALINEHGFRKFEYQLPDEYRLDELLSEFAAKCGIPVQAYDTEHFYTKRFELRDFFAGKKQYLMESFYRMMRKKHHVLMDGDQPMMNHWNFDHENRKKMPANHHPVVPFVFDHDLSELSQEIHHAGVVTLGDVDPKHYIWPLNRTEALEVLRFFLKECLPFFGTFQDAMSPSHWSLYHSRLSFAMNLKLISPHEVIQSSIDAYHNAEGSIAFHQLEGFVRQIIGWREYMRGMYWHRMPGFSAENFFGHDRKLPDWYWSGRTKMACLKHAITQSLQYAYAHHIQRLMITGNFALLAGINPDEVDLWYLGIYIDAIEWVEITNTRGMSQFADGGCIATKPYVSSSTYIDKMSHYCGACYYDKNKKTGDKSCPFNSLYWHFFARNESLLRNNPRIGMMYQVWYKMNDSVRKSILEQAEKYLDEVNKL